MIVTICQVSDQGLYLAHREVDLTVDTIPPGWFVLSPPANLDVPNRRDGETWIELAPEDVPEPTSPPFVPIRLSRLDFRRLLRPEEAARFRLLEAAPKVTSLELAQAFDPQNPNPELQIRVAVEDAMQQWGLLDQGVIELNHPDTAEFLAVMGMAGMFGDQASARIPQILNQVAPA